MGERAEERWLGSGRGRAVRVLGWLAALLVLGACAAPVGVERVAPYKAQSDLTTNVLSSGEISEKARILLRRANREEAWKKDPAGVLKDLHEGLAQPVTRFNAELRASLLYSVAELAFAHASASDDRRYYLAAAIYAWLYLFPSDETLRPNPLDRGVRLAADLYNRGLTLAFTDHETGEVVVEDSGAELPFGTLDLDLDEDTLQWGNRSLTHFVAITDLEIHGIQNRYRVPGLGVPLAGRIAPLEDAQKNDWIFSNVRVPISVLVKFENAEEALQHGAFKAAAFVVPFSSENSTSIHGQRVPIEIEPTAALALQLTEDPPWKREIKGFFQGDLGLPESGLVSLAPYHRGRIPLVLVHGTASSAGRWADLLNDLGNDEVLRRHFQFWLFTYNTGNPILYSGWLLRKAIADLVETLDPEGTDPALQDLVVMGHSQGGLLTKLLTVDAGTLFWDLTTDRSPDELELKPENRELLEGSLLVEPSPYVGRVIFLATPHHGTRLANLGAARLMGRAIRSPANLVNAAREIFSDDAEVDVQNRLKEGGGSVGNMSPESPFIQILSSLPVAPPIQAHSIIGVQKEPKEEGSDGIVTYQSAHLDDVASELVIQSGHSSQSNPLVVSEVRRILIEHLSAAIASGTVQPSARAGASPGESEAAGEGEATGEGAGVCTGACTGEGAE